MEGVEMRGLLIGLALVLSSCNPYSTRFDNKMIVDYCTRSAECTMELMDDDDYPNSYDIQDEAAYQQLAVELCVDEYIDTLEMAELFDCKSEVKAAYKCDYENRPLRCDYDDDEAGWDEYYEDIEKVEDETCWQETAEAEYRFDW